MKFHLICAAALTLLSIVSQTYGLPIDEKDILGRGLEYWRRRKGQITRGFDDIPNQVMPVIGFANETSAHVSFFSYEAPKVDDALDTYDGPFNLFRRYTLNNEEEQRLRERSYWIRADFDDTSSQIFIMNETYTRASQENGVTESWLPVTSYLAEANSSKAIQYTVKSQERNGQEASSFIEQSRNQGTMVIADIDDVLKETNTQSLSETLANTFWREYHPVQGMPQVMDSLDQDPDTTFHYVTGIPIVLYKPLSDWLLSVYPFGSFSFRPATQLDWASLGTTLGGGSYRSEAIARLLETFSDKRAVIFGDTWGTSLKSFANLMKDYSSRDMCYYLRRFGTTSSDDSLYASLSTDSGLAVDKVKTMVHFYNQAEDLLTYKSLAECQK